ncbi:hypothetical protein O181_000499 [Austropuccinia psidii MF-1]|uniref:Uncharacterized protein n=1 Tax=Austropuccinia psidii MF-1 TaxID=1389203 RepID=A0A9Q3B8Q1_9BASI|nr:hypothetical protein [Austropuccinia psidii MF-1]
MSNPSVEEHTVSNLSSGYLSLASLDGTKILSSAESNVVNFRGFLLNNRIFCYMADADNSSSRPNSLQRNSPNRLVLEVACWAWVTCTSMPMNQRSFNSHKSFFGITVSLCSGLWLSNLS